MQASLKPYCLLIALAWCVVSAVAEAQPNIVLIMADDLGWCDTSNTLTTMGHPSDFYETPAIDRLAGEGMAFTNAYTNGCNCAPTRAAILSGQWAQRPTNNVYLVGHTNRGGKNQMLQGPPQGITGNDDKLPAETYTYAEHLRDHAGYETAHFGKFHVTTDDESVTTEHGFVKNFGGGLFGAPTAYHATGGEFGGHIGPALDAFGDDYTQQYVDQNIKPFSKGVAAKQLDALVGTPKHVSDAMTDAAIGFIQSPREKPFLVQFHSYAVHTPIGDKQARRDLLSKYRQKPAGQEDDNASFAALIEGLDQNVARLIDCLRTTPNPSKPGQMLAANTLVVFYSDNGGKLNQSNNGPLKGEKGELDEGGIRVPFIVWSANPKLVAGGTVNATPVYGIDIYPTFSALAGVDLPSETKLDGADLSGLFADAEAKLDREDLFWHLPGYLIGGGRDQRPQTVMRSGKWKLLYNYEDQTYELYDLLADIGEQQNLAEQQPAVVEQLATRMLHWLADTQAPLPKLRTGEIALQVTGPMYVDGQVTDNAGKVSLGPGDEVPFVVPSS